MFTSQNIRVSIFVTALILIFVMYITYLFYLQVIQGYVYTLRAEQIAIRTTVIPAKRGKIYDRNYDTPLVTNKSAFAVSIIAGEISVGMHKEVFFRLAETLDIDVARIEQRVPAHLYTSYREIVIERSVPKKSILYIAENKHLFPGVTWQPYSVRSYPYKELMSHILGYVGEIDQSELEVLFSEGYAADSILGKNGIELQYDKELRGHDGLRIRRVDARGKQVQEAVLEEIAPQPGDNLVLTIDRKIQLLASKSLGERSGSVVVMKPATGEILALVSYPKFNPNIFSGQTLESSAFSMLSLDPLSPFLNRAIQSVAAPASTFKLVMATAIAELRPITLEHTVQCTGSTYIGNRKFHCWLPSGHGQESFFDALADSCNVYFYTVGVEHLGIDTIIDYADRYGLGQKTGIDLPGEIKGLLPSPEWKEEIIRDVWREGDTANISIGQGYIQVTPIQMASLLSMIINDGVSYKPRLLLLVRDPVSGIVKRTFKKEPQLQMQIEDRNFAIMRKALRGVITQGTAKIVITTPAVKIAGKTGTGQVSTAGERYNSWFLAFAPYETSDPEERIVVAVMVDSNNEWEWWAPKAANLIFHGIFTDQTFEEATEDLKKKGLLWYM